MHNASKPIGMNTGYDQTLEESVSKWARIYYTYQKYFFLVLHEEKKMKCTLYSV